VGFAANGSGRTLTTKDTKGRKGKRQNVRATSLFANVDAAERKIRKNLSRESREEMRIGKKRIVIVSSRKFAVYLFRFGVSARDIPQRLKPEIFSNSTRRSKDLLHPAWDTVKPEGVLRLRRVAL
jgi:hypothetical protein